ncbi:hypothetical protein CEE45_16615 [Candidatus Heimdallarchaeota archaeon B3_Heim]|nr:MAG: hypothetical protein CEE45_16615 [Candidatus Heimdallarchaeota archaeon B3_Heim]
MVLTVAVRALEFQNGNDLLRSYLDMIADNSNLSLNLVAGHPAYDIDQTVSVENALNKSFTQIRQRTDRPMFLGIENLSTRIIKSICRSYSPVIPFALNGDYRVMNGFSKKISCPLAIYTPLAIETDQFENNISDFLPYLLRRRVLQDRLKAANLWKDELTNSTWSEFSRKAQKIIRYSLNELIITDANIDKKLMEFRSHNVKLLVGYPAISSIKNQQIEGFKIS